MKDEILNLDDQDMTNICKVSAETKQAIVNNMKKYGFKMPTNHFLNRNWSNSCIQRYRYDSTCKYYSLMIKEDERRKVKRNIYLEKTDYFKEITQGYFDNMDEQDIEIYSAFNYAIKFYGMPVFKHFKIDEDTLHAEYKDWILKEFVN